jgi:hypothetical protein
MSPYEIEKNIAPPEGYSNKQGRYPLAIMEVGDSFFVPLSEGRNQVSSMIAYYHARGVRTRRDDPNVKVKRFITRKVDGGFRVWRIM